MAALGAMTIVLTLIGIAVLVIAIAVLVPTAVLVAEVVAAFIPGQSWPGKPAGAGSQSRPRLAVLVPAHDEALGIGETLTNLRAQLSPQDRLLVVADNCTDTTADVAAALGAEVVQRVDPDRRGKSFALDYGVRHLADAPPDVVIIVDADCKPDPGCLAKIGALAFDSGRPVQATYEFLVPENSATPGLRIVAFAAKLKTCLRPLGLSNLGLPCQLAGTGMAFPWSILSGADLKTGELAEDLVLGLDLARAGAAPIFCPGARITTLFPVSREGQSTQRARWETGHLTTLAGRLPRLLVEAVRTGNFNLLALVLDAAVPPLALLSLAVVVAVVISGLWAAISGAKAPLAASGLAALSLGLSIFLAWWKIGRDNITLIELAKTPVYVLSKIPLYAQILIGRRVSWIRSKRD